MTQSQRDRTDAAFAFLQAARPDLFNLNAPKPFAIGIFNQVREAYPQIGITPTQGVLRWLTCRRAYLVACTQGAPRYGLTGPLGEVSAKEATYARRRFHERNERASDKWQIAA